MYENYLILTENIFVFKLHKGISEHWKVGNSDYILKYQIC